VSAQKTGRLDLNLLVHLHVLLEERNVTRAAARLTLSQPAMSASLARLRRQLGDDLLVREGRGMVLTPAAVRMRPEISRTVELFQRAVAERSGFDPDTSAATITILAGDYAALVLLQPLIRKLESEARHIRLRVRPINDDYAIALRSGKADIAIAPTTAADQAGLHAATAFEDRLVYVMDTANPAATGSPSDAGIDQLPRLSPANLYTPAAAPAAGNGHHRSYGVTTPTAILSAYMVQGTDFASLLPHRVALLLQQHLDIATTEPPGQPLAISTSIYWSARTENDAGHSWLRAKLLETARELR
jgi:DNA-binding transcriptional LysR family regulator